MRTSLLLCSIALLISGSAAAQCVPDTSITHNIPGVYPDTLTGLPHAALGQVYATTIQVKAVRDTVYQGLPATIDSMVISGVTGLPSGFSYTCTPSSCSFPGGSNGCILLQSSGPVAGPAGVYPISVNLMNYGRLLGTIPATVPFSITGYAIVIDPAAGISTVSMPTRLMVSEFSPNPVSHLTGLTVGVPEPGLVRLETVDLLGNLVRQESFDAARGWNTFSINADGLRSGIYLTRVAFGKDLSIRRMVVTAN
ncbi:MAG: hypothetical protein RL021_435 [Bacteroidota bacterium]|jgi:hypothetical protein